MHTTTRTPTIIPITTGIPMAEAGALYRLMTWLSPGYPVGAFSYSHGLEQAVEAALVCDRDSAEGWIADIVKLGTGFTDGVFLAEAFRAAESGDRGRLADIAELAAAFVATGELAREAQAQGAAFFEITAKNWPAPALALLREVWDGPIAYPVVVGCAAAGHSIALEDALPAYLHAFAANLVSAAVRLVPLSQSDGQKIVAVLEPVVADSCARALVTSPEAAGGAALMVDIASMNHETQYTRLFRS